MKKKQFYSPRTSWFFLGLLLSTSLFVGGATAAGITSSGVVESSSGGFRFPDGSLQTTASDLATHSADAGAHHARYADTEAVAAIKAADGTGSALDADLLDGLHATDVIASAVSQSVVATPISSLPFTISQPGSYYLTGNLDGSGGGLRITTDNVTLDLMGFTMDGGGAINDYGIRMPNPARKNVTIKNGTVRGFGDTGISQSTAGGENIHILHVQVLDNGYSAPSYRGAGISIAASHSMVVGCTASNNTGDGIKMGDYATINDNTVLNNGSGGGTSAKGIRASTGSMIIGNVVSGQLGSGSNNAGIFAAYSTVLNNSVSSSQSWGILAGGYIKGNYIYNNNLSDNPSLGGLKIYYDGSRVEKNTLVDNKQNGIYAAGQSSILQDNFIKGTSPGNGIYFWGNAVNKYYYRDNMASRNGTDFNTGTATVTDGGGNVGF